MLKQRRFLKTRLYFIRFEKLSDKGSNSYSISHIIFIIYVLQTFFTNKGRLITHKISVIFNVYMKGSEPKQSRFLELIVSDARYKSLDPFQI